MCLYQIDQSFSILPHIFFVGVSMRHAIARGACISPPVAAVRAIWCVEVHESCFPYHNYIYDAYEYCRFVFYNCANRQCGCTADR